MVQFKVSINLEEWKYLRLDAVINTRLHGTDLKTQDRGDFV